jgi:hypothetical protein
MLSRGKSLWTRLENLERQKGISDPVFMVTFFDGTQQKLGLLELWNIAMNVKIGGFEGQAPRPYKDFRQIRGKPYHSHDYGVIPAQIDYQKGRQKRDPYISDKIENGSMKLIYPDGKEFPSDPDAVPVKG